MTPEKKLFEGKVFSLNVPGTSGYFEVLSHHAPLVSSLTHGVVTVVDENRQKETFWISGGVFEVGRNGCVLLADHEDEEQIKRLEKEQADKEKHHGF